MTNRGDFYVEFRSNASKFSEKLGNDLAGANTAISGLADHVNNLVAALTKVTDAEIAKLGAIRTGTGGGGGGRGAGGGGGGGGGIFSVPELARLPGLVGDLQKTVANNEKAVGDLARAIKGLGTGGNGRRDPVREAAEEAAPGGAGVETLGRRGHQIAAKASDLAIALQGMLDNLRDASTELQGTRRKSRHVAQVAEGLNKHIAAIGDNIGELFNKLQTSLNKLGELEIPGFDLPDNLAAARRTTGGATGATEADEPAGEEAPAPKKARKRRKAKAEEQSASASELEAKTAEELAKLTPNQIRLQQRILDAKAAEAKADLAVARAAVQQLEQKAKPLGQLAPEGVTPALYNQLLEVHKGRRPEELDEVQKTIGEIYQRGGRPFPGGERLGERPEQGGLFQRLPENVRSAAQRELSQVVVEREGKRTTVDDPKQVDAIRRKQRIELEGTERIIQTARQIRDAFPNVNLIKDLDQFPKGMQRTVAAVGLAIAHLDKLRLSLGRLSTAEREERAGPGALPSEVARLRRPEQARIFTRAAYAERYLAEQQEKDAAARERGAARSAPRAAFRDFAAASGLRRLDVQRDFPAQHDTPELRSGVQNFNKLLDRTGNAFSSAMRAEGDKRVKLEERFNRLFARTTEAFAGLTGRVKTGTLEEQAERLQAAIKQAEQAGLGRVVEHLTGQLANLEQRLGRSAANREENELSREQTRAGVRPIPGTRQEFLQRVSQQEGYQQAEEAQRQLTRVRRLTTAGRPQVGRGELGDPVEDLAAFLGRAPTKITDVPGKKPVREFDLGAADFRAAAARIAQLQLGAAKGEAEAIEFLDRSLLRGAKTIGQVADLVGQHRATIAKEGPPEETRVKRTTRARGPVAEPEGGPTEARGRVAAGAAAPGRDTAILQAMLETLRALLQCCHDGLGRGGRAAAAAPRVPEGVLGNVPVSADASAKIDEQLNVAATGAAEGLKRVGRAADESADKQKRASRLREDVLKGLAEAGSGAPAIRKAGGSRLQFAEQLRSEADYTVPQAAKLTTEVYGGGKRAQKILETQLLAEAAGSKRSEKAADGKSAAEKKAQAALDARAEREKLIASIEGQFSQETRDAIQKMLQLERALGKAGDSVQQLGQYPEVHAARLNVATRLPQERAIAGVTGQKRTSTILGATGPELNDLKREAAFAVESYKQGALQAAEGSGLASSLARIFFGNQSILQSVAHTAGRFIIRNLSASLVFGLQNAMQAAVASVLEAEQAFVRLSNALEQVGGSSGVLRSQLQGVAVELGTSLEDTYKVAAQLVGVFENPADIGFGTEIILRLEKISQGALNGVEGVRSLRAVTSAFGDEGAQSLEHVADVVTRLQDLSGVNLEDVIEGLASIGTLADGMNLSLEFTAALVTQIAKGTGQSGSASAEQLGRIMARLQSSASQGQLVAMGVGVTQEQFSSSDYQGVLEQILKGWDTLSSAQQDAVSRLLGGVREQRAARTFLEGHAAVLANAAKAADSYGASAERTAKIMGTLRGEFQQLRSSLVAIVQNLVQSGLFDFLGTLIHALNMLLRAFNTVFSGVNTLIERIPLGSFFRGVVAQVGGFVAAIFLGQRAFRLFMRELAAAKTLAQGKGFLGGPAAAAAAPGQLSFGEETGPARTGFGARYAAAQTRPTYGLVGNLPVEDRGFFRRRVWPAGAALGQTIAAQEGGLIAGGLRGAGGFLSARGATYDPNGPSVTRFRTQLRELGDRMQGVGEHLSRAGLLQRGGAYVAQRTGLALGAIPKLDLRLVDQGESVGRLRGALGSLGGGMTRLGLQMQRTGVIARFAGTAIERGSQAASTLPRMAAGLLEFALIVGTVGQMFWEAYRTRRDQLTAVKTLTDQEKAAADEASARGLKQTAQQRDASSYGVGDAAGDVVTLLGQAFIPGRGSATRSLGRMLTAGVTNSVAAVPLREWQQKQDDFLGRIAQNAGSLDTINLEMGNVNKEIDAEINAMIDRQDLTQSEKTAGVALLQQIKQTINDDAENRRRKLQGLANIDRLTDEQIAQLTSLMDFYRSIPQAAVESIPGLVPLVEEGLPDAYKNRLRDVRGAGASGRPGLEAQLYRDMARDIQGRLQQKVYVEPAEIESKTKEMEGYYQQFYAKMVEQAEVTANGAKALADVVRDEGDVGTQIQLLQQAERALAEGVGYAAAEGDAAKLASAYQSLQETRRAIVEAAYQPILGQLDAYAAIIRNPVTQGRLKLQQAEIKLNYVRQFSDRFGPDAVRQAYVAWAQAQDELAGNLEELADAQGKFDLAGVSGSVERSAVQATQAAEKAARTIQRDKDAYARAAALEAENRKKFDSLVAQGKFEEAQLYSGAPPPPGFFASGAVPGQPGLQPASDQIARLNDNVVGTLRENVGKPLDSILSQMKLGIPVWVQNLPAPVPGPGALPEPDGLYYTPTGKPTVSSRDGRFAARPGDFGEPGGAGTRTTTTGTAPQYQSRLPADEQSAQATNDLADSVTAAKQHAQEMEQLAQLRAQTALALIRDPVRRAQLQLNEADRRLGVAVGEGVAEYERALQEQIQAQQSLADAYHELNQAIINLAKAQEDFVGHTVESSRLGVALAHDSLLHAIAQYGAGSTQVLQAQAGLINAQAAYRDTVLSEQTESIDFLLQMEEITSGTAIQMLQQLLRNGDLTEKQRRSLLLKIKGLQDDIRNSLSQGFNIPSEIRLPTPYEVRRSLSAQNGLRPSNLATVVNTSNNVTNNNTFNQTVSSPAQVQQIAQAVVGILNDQTTQAVRSNQSTPHLVGV